VLREGNLAIREELEKCFAGFGDEDLVKLLLKKLDNVTSEVAFWLYRLIISTGKSTAAIIIKQISDSSSDKLIWLTKIMGELKDDAFVQPLLSFLSNSNKNVRYEATKVISKFSGDILSKELLEIYLNEDEEGRIAIIENFKALSSQEMLETLSTKLNDASEKHAYWIAKLLAETAKESLDFFKQQEKTASKTDKTSYWMKRIIEHIEGKSYL
jgi:HEAT repeat protein